VGRLRGQALAAFTEEVGEPSWRTVPSAYVVCTDDQALSPEARRRMAARIGGEVPELDASHSPNLSNPRAVADILKSV
jgi:pimeloyl-ACP methyl ester carboxylesterase